MPTMLPEIVVQLAGRVGSWHPRHVRDQARTVWAAWLRAPRYGTIGVYVLAKPNALLELAEALPGAAWLHLRGVLRPLRVLALPDDVRAADDTASAPLLVHAVQITRARRIDAAPLLLPAPAFLQVRAGVRTEAGELAPAAHLPDLYHLAVAPHAHGQVRSWSRLCGVVAPVGSYRYLRYVVTEAEHEPVG
jgi:hypothetical protein